MVNGEKDEKEMLKGDTVYVYAKFMFNISHMLHQIVCCIISGWWDEKKMGKLFRYLYQVDEEKKDKRANKGRKWKNVASVDV